MEGNIEGELNASAHADNYQELAGGHVPAQPATSSSSRTRCTKRWPSPTMTRTICWI